MKKYIPIILGCIIVAAIAFAFMRNKAPESTTGDAHSNQENTNGPAKPEEARKPADIKAALYDPATAPSALTKLLEKRLKALGYQVSITNTLPDPLQAGNPMTTLFLRSNMTPSMSTLQHTFLNSSVIRQIANDAFPEDILIATWNFEDIRWGDQASEAQKLTLPDAASVGVIVYNAGAASGAAGTFVDTLKSQGYDKAEAKNTDTILTGSSIIYFQKGYKGTAKKLMETLKANGYPDRTYRARQDQEAPIVVMLAAPGSQTATTTPAQ